MSNRYYKIEFQRGNKGSGFQVIDSNGNFVRLTDDDGNTLDFSDGTPCEYSIVDRKPANPSWAADEPAE